MIDTPSLPCSADKLIPHRDGMLLIEELIERPNDKTGAIASARLDGQTLIQGSNKKLTPEFFVEIIAQTAAAANGFDGIQAKEQPKNGFVVGLDDFIFSDKTPENPLLRAEIIKIFAFGNTTIFDGKLFSDSLLLASGKIQVWEED